MQIKTIYFKDELSDTASVGTLTATVLDDGTIIGGALPPDCVEITEAEFNSTIDEIFPHVAARKVAFAESSKLLDAKRAEKRKNKKR